MNRITEEEIEDKLIRHYGSGRDRDLVRNKRGDDYGDEVGSVVYSLRGSPPKGYALYVPELREISFYDRGGKRFRHMTNTVVDELEEK